GPELGPRVDGLAHRAPSWTPELLGHLARVDSLILEEIRFPEKLGAKGSRQRPLEGETGDADVDEGEPVLLEPTCIEWSTQTRLEVDERPQQRCRKRSTCGER